MLVDYVIKRDNDIIKLINGINMILNGLIKRDNGVIKFIDKVFNSLIIIYYIFYIINNIIHYN